MFAWIRELQQEGIAILLIEQNARAALDVAHCAHVMDQGRFSAEGPAARLKAEEDIVARYLGRRADR
jgi:branched-chain amino acid transport system ATP-binding protein